MTTPQPQTNIEFLIRDLPDAEGARLFWGRLEQEQPRAARKLLREENAGLLADALALAAWSPLLATTLAQNQHYFSWLGRERANTRVKTREELGESLGRFALTNSQLEAQVLLARFRRRELLRIYLRDLRRTATLVETTEELSNLADAILAHALGLARNDLDNKYGPPLQVDDRGRAAPAAFCVVALGKLGSRELNYASDIDLLFLFSDNGSTSGAGERGATTNREYFCKLAEAVARLAGQPAGEGAAYRVDLRLRPYGRDGALASSLAEAVRYYREKAQAWELQTLIRARAAAGDAALYAAFADELRPFVYAPDKSVPAALADVKLAKQKIDRQHPPRNGFNVKLGKGGVREIEFIAQALQLAHGGRDEWLRAPHTLISLSRLADRQLVSERELSELAESYGFLRHLEHRLQMEQGLQTHLVPEDTARRELLARRMDFASLADFDAALAAHTENVSRAFQRVFGEACPANLSLSATMQEMSLPEESDKLKHVEHPDPETAHLSAAAAILAGPLGAGVTETEAQLALAAAGSLNPRRALALTARLAASLDKWPEAVKLNRERLAAVVKLCGASDFFGETLAGNPSLINAVPLPDESPEAPDYQALLRQAVTDAPDLSAALSGLRRAWSPLFLAIGARDAAGRITRREATRRQTALAEAALCAAQIVAEQELARRHSLPFSLSPSLPLAILGLGRLGSGGMDYGSDLDLVLVYDDTAPPPAPALTHAEGYRRLAELLALALSSLTRDGYLYRVDLRLRPDGRNGPTVSAASAFLSYLRERAAPWEWLAYVKLRATAGGDWAIALENKARTTIHEAAQALPREQLRDETRRMRARLEAERAQKRPREVDIKYGAGGLLDVYFAARYLQLRDNVPDTGAERSTTVTLKHLLEAGSLSKEAYAELSAGYEFLRELDHRLRLVSGRSTRLPAAGHAVLEDIAKGLSCKTAENLLSELRNHTRLVRVWHDKLTTQL